MNPSGSCEENKCSFALQIRCCLKQTTNDRFLTQMLVCFAIAQPPFQYHHILTCRGMEVNVHDVLTSTVLVRFGPEQRTPRCWLFAEICREDRTRICIVQMWDFLGSGMHQLSNTDDVISFIFFFF